MQSLILDPPAIYALVDKVAINKAHATKTKTLFLAFIAGAFIAIGCQAYINVTASATVTPPLVLLGSIFFATGLYCIVSLGAELFTGNCMMLMAWFEGHLTLGEIAVEWAVVYAGNFIGCLLFAALNHGAATNSYPQQVFTPAGSRLCQLVSAKANEPPHAMFFKGILANFCVCMAVLLAMSSRSGQGKVYAVVFPLVCFIVCGYDHSIANLYFFIMATISNCNAPDHGLYWANLVLCTAGNICGAAILSLTYWFSFLRGEELPGSPRIFRKKLDPSPSSSCDPTCNNPV